MKTILVTGAGGFLGRAVVNLLLEKEYRVIAVVHSGKDIERMQSHPQLHIEILALENEEAVGTAIINLFDQYKRLDAAILLAGGYVGGTLKDTSIKDIRGQIELNFETAYTVVKSIYPYFLQNKKGRIILIGSQAPLMPHKGKTSLAYALSKSLLFQLAEILNEEAKGTDVVTTVVVPSTIDTEANRKAMPDADVTKWVKPEALAEIIEFAISDKSAPLREPVLKVYNREA